MAQLNTTAIIRSAWDGGFVTDLTVAADGAGLNGWTVSFDAPFNLVNLWNARVISHVGNRYVLGNLDYNGAVPANGSTGFGFQAAGTPAQFTLINGAIAAAPPRLSIADASIAEPVAGVASVLLTVMLDRAATHAVTVAYATSPGTAAAGSDYTTTTGSLTFAPGETSKTIPVPVLADNVAELAESFVVNLSNASGADIGDGQGQVTIANTGGEAPTPTLSAAPVMVTEPGTGTKAANFTVTLSVPTTGPVSVAYFTADATATAGQDYTAVSGTLNFAAGETSKTIAVPILADARVEGAETFTLNLTHASGAVPPSLTATGTINDPAAPGTNTGFLSTNGNQIVNAAGAPVQINATSWFGGESNTYVPHGMWTRDYHSMLDQMVELGFNAIRLPYSDEAFLPGKVPNGIDFFQNPDLRGLTVIQVYDKIIAYAGEVGLKVFFDHHRTEAGAGPNGNGLWYSDITPESKMIDTWEMLATRYGQNPTVIGADLNNEPHHATWGDGSATDWRAGAERIGNAILAIAPDWLIIVEGTGQYQGENYWWGGNLQGVRDAPVRLDVPNKLVYSPHDYPNSIFPQPWFNAPDFPNNMDEIFRENWGYIDEEGIAPILLGEWGSKFVDPKDAGWLAAITKYIAGDLDQNGTRDIPVGDLGMSWAWWAWNPNSGDTGGILKDDWTTAHLDKVNALKPVMFGLIQDGSAGGGGGGGMPGPMVEASFVTSGALAVGSIAAGVTHINLTGDNLGAGSLDHLQGLKGIELSADMTPLSATFSAADANAFQGRIIHVTAPNTDSLGVDGRALGADVSLRVVATHGLVAYGGAGDDVFTAGDGSSVMQGGAGNDRFVFNGLAALGAAQVDGGAGTDTLEFGPGVTLLPNGGFSGKSGLEAIVMTAPGIVSAALGNTAVGAFGGQLTLSAPNATSVNFNGVAAQFGTLIFYGTAGGDTLVGGAGDDWLIGAGGADLLHAGAGQDTIVMKTAAALTQAAELRGGAGFDTLKLETGNAITDAAFAHSSELEHLQLAGGGVQSATLGNGAATAFGGRVTITAPGATALVVDATAMTAGVVDIYATLGGDTLRGGSGADLFRSLGQGDSSRGGGGNDGFQFGSVADFAGKALLDGGAGYDMVSIGGGGLVLDAMFANVFGIETLAFSLGADALVGPGAGRATVRLGSAAEAAFTVNPIAIQLTGGALTVDGSGLAIKGFVATGGAGEDMFIGSGQNDVFIGGAGNDSFLFGAHGGSDRIEGWNDGDRIVMQSLSEAQVAQMLAAATEAAGTTQLGYDGGNSAIFLVGVAKASLGMEDFIWGV